MKRPRGQPAGLSARLDEIRAHHRAGLTQAESARALGVDATSLRYWLIKLGLSTNFNAGVDPSLNWLKRLHVEPDPLPEIIQHACSASPTSILDLGPDQCRWPLESTFVTPSRKTLFCGAHAEPGSSYCGRHHAVAYRA